MNIPGSRRTRRLLSILLLIALHPRPSAGFPQYDPVRELDVLHVPAPPESTGVWSLDDSGLSLQQGDPSHEHDYWLPGDSGAWMADGMVRARISLGAAPDFSVLVRAQVDPLVPEEIWAYGLNLHGDELALYRWEQGLALPMGPVQRVTRLSQVRSVEIVIFCDRFAKLS